MQWTETINKMRSAYGAPIGAGQVDALAAYLTRVVPAFGNQLSDAQIAAVLTYVRSQWGNKATAVNPSLVSAQRAATAARGGAWNGDIDLAR
jgi:hypothetical protein